MCYYHVAANCKKRYATITDDVKNEIKGHIRNLHMSVDEHDFNEKLNLFKEYSTNNCSNFFKYLNDVWLKGKFTHWQIFKRPAGYYCTNSPLESFNSSIKRTFTIRKKLSIYNFVRLMLKIAKYYSKNQEDFELNSSANSKTKKFVLKYAKVDFF